ncbi:MAG: sugar transferase [Candidatus Omnitrophica bacterium]|nr:sugar transferase [Candidatus Omnitrophota bacterium]
MLKRSFDIIFSLTGLILAFPLGVVIALLIKVEDGGPIFYSQARIGKDNKVFKILKFRSMVPNAEKDIGPTLSLGNDARSTKIGKRLRKSALDELPQLINILKGDMSFVGPRTERPEFVKKFCLEFPDFTKRNAIRPGLTGVAQVFGSHYLNFREKFKYDIWYVKNRTFFLDFYLIFLSFLVTFNSKWEVEGDKFRFLGGALKNKIESQLNDPN